MASFIPGDSVAGGRAAAGATGTYFAASGQHGNAEQWFGGATTNFGLTPPGSRASTPPRRTRRTLPHSPGPASPRDTSRRRSRSDSRDRSREDRSSHSRVAGDEQPLPEGWGARMLGAEKRIREHAEALKNLQALIQSTMTTATQRTDILETQTIEIDGMINRLGQDMTTRLTATEARQEAYVVMLNELTSKIVTQFDNLTQ